MSEHASRLAKFMPGQLDEQQQRLYDAIVSTRTQGPHAFALVDDAGGLEGPFNAMLLQPALGAALQSLGVAIRFGGVLSDRAREIAILVVAATYDSEFERYAHEAVGRAIGLSEDELGALRTGMHDVLADAAERMVADTVRELSARGDLSDDAFTGACELIGRDGLFELTTLVGYYTTLAVQLRVFRVELPAS